MRSILIVAGLIVVGLLALLFYRDIETRDIASQALQSSEKLQLELAKARATVNVVSAQLDGRILPVRKTRVTIYSHESGLTDQDAVQLASTLKPYGFDVRVTRQNDARRPDAVFIGAVVSAEEAQLVLSSVPYDVDYLFRLDLPRQLGGDPDGRSIGVGYVAALAAKSDDPRGKPVKISRRELASLLQPKLTNTEFQSRLRKIAGP
ncbi:MAG TPA: hypothetical protein VNU64_03295 [Burkholderiales bacterium]|nr:hypothetical protein [Burkholderiales bacterium]